jgi:hypothetical protein
VSVLAAVRAAALLAAYLGHSDEAAALDRAVLTAAGDRSGDPVRAVLAHLDAMPQTQFQIKRPATVPAEGHPT